MAATSITVTYDDGRVETYEIRPKTMVQAERALGKSIADHALEATYLAAWKASKSRDKFDDWLDTVEGLQEQGADDAGTDAVDPTGGPSPSESPG